MAAHPHVPAGPAAPPARRRKATGGTAAASAPKRLTDLVLGEVSCVDVPANPGARHLLFKGLGMIEKQDAEGAQAGEATEARVAELEAKLRERDEQIAWMAEKMAGDAPPAQRNPPAHTVEADCGPEAERPASAEKATAPVSVAKASAPAPDPMAEFRGLAIVAREHPGKGGRAFWHGELVALGKALAPELPPNEQVRAALATEEGRAFLAAKVGAPAAVETSSGRVEEVSTAKAEGMDVVAEALAYARAGGERAPSYWRAAIAALGERLAPGQSPSAKIQAVAATPQGRTLFAALTGDPSNLTGR